MDIYVWQYCIVFFFSSRRRHTRYWRDWSSDVCSSDLRGSRTTIPLAAGRAQEGETILEQRLSKPCWWSVRPPGSVRTRSRSCRMRMRWPARSGGLHHRALDDDAAGRELPERDEELSSQGDNRRPLPAAVVVPHALLEPQAQLRRRLAPQPQPCKLDHPGQPPSASPEASLAS